MRNCAGNGRCKLCLKFFVKTPHHTLRFSVSRRSCTRQTWLEFKESLGLKIMESKDQKMMIEGVQYHWKKDLQTFFNKDGAWEMSILSHMRSIGDRTISFTANKKIVDGEVSQWIIQKFETTLAGNEITGFKKDWEDNWQPKIDEPFCTVENELFSPSDIYKMEIFFKKLHDFLN